MSFFGGGGSILFLINRHRVVHEILLNPLHGDRWPAHISGDGFNAISICSIYFLVTMDLETGVLILGHQQVDQLLCYDFSLE